MAGKHLTKQKVKDVYVEGRVAGEYIANLEKIIVDLKNLNNLSPYAKMWLIEKGAHDLLRFYLRDAKFNYNEFIKIDRKYLNSGSFKEINIIYRRFIKSYKELEHELRELERELKSSKLGLEKQAASSA